MLSVKAWIEDDEPSEKAPGADQKRPLSHVAPGATKTGVRSPRRRVATSSGGQSDTLGARYSCVMRDRRATKRPRPRSSASRGTSRRNRGREPTAPERRGTAWK